MAVNLEKNRTPFVGRANEREALKDAMERSRIVTLVGPGGVGKSRIAREFFNDLGLEPVQLWLDELKDGLEIPAHLVRAMGLQPSGKADMQRAVSELIDSKTILFFDNAEHLLEDLRAVVAALPARVLVTAREPLNLPEETVLVISELSEDDGLLLLQQHALLRGVNVSDDPGRALVRALDSLPLAIELAAARLVILDPEQLLERLLETNQALGTNRAGRHTTLDQTMEWSWNALSLSEQDLMSVLASFDHPMDPVMLESLWPDVDVLEVALGLESKSWLRVAQTSAGRRWSTLSVLRRFVRSKLALSQKENLSERLQAWGQRHLDEAPGWWASYIPEGLHVTQTMAQHGNPIDASRLLSKLFFGSFGGALFSPVLDQAHRLLNQMSPVEHPIAFAELATKLAKGAFRFRGKHRAIEWSQRALDVAPRSSNTWLAAASQHVLSLVDEGRREDASTLFAEVTDSANSLADDMKIASVLLDVASAAHEMGHFEALRAICQRVLEIGRAAGNADAEARAWIHLSYASYDLGEFERASEEAGNLDVLMAERHPHERLVVGGAVPPLLKLQMGRPDECYADLKEREAIAQETRHYGLEFYILLGLAEWASTHDTQAAQGFLLRALNNASVNDSHKSVAHARFLLALEELASNQPTSAQRRFGLLMEDERPPANPEEWRDALVSFDWLCNQLLNRSNQPPPESPFGKLVEATLQSIDGESKALPSLIRSTSPSAYTVPGLYLTRLDAVAQRIAARLSRSGPVLRMDREGRRFQIDSGEIQDMTRKGVTRKILFRLAQIHSETPGCAMTVSDVIEAGWPGEIISHEAAQTRVYTIMNRMRAAGLSDLLITQDDGYALSPHLRIDWVDTL